MCTIYTASKPRHSPMWRARREEGHEIIATWIDYGPEDSDIPDWEKLWLDCVDEASRADITLVYLEDGDELRGAYVEMGVALAAGKRVYMVNRDKVRVTDAIHHPMVTEFATLDEALNAAWGY